MPHQVDVSRHLYFTLGLLIVSTPGPVSALQWIRFHIPRWVQENSDVRLTCQFDVEKDLLYSVKWYKQGREFYRFVPAETRIKQDYPLPGVIVDESHSSAQHVTLRSVSRSSSGRYKCEVLAEAPLFRTLVRSAEMGVVQLPQGPPSVSGGREVYSPGSNVSLNCTAPASLPPAHLIWYINDQQVRVAPQEYLINYHHASRTNDGSQSPSLGLHFTAQPWHFPAGEVRLRCMATLHHLYSMEARHRGVADPLHHHGERGFAESSAGSRGRFRQNHLMSGLYVLCCAWYYSCYCTTVLSLPTLMIMGL